MQLTEHPSKRSQIEVKTNGYRRLIARLEDAASPTAPHFVWLGGFRSDMVGSKAESLSRWCIKNGYGCTRFDYSGHGESGGAFVDGSISIWTEETLAVLNKIEAEKIFLVGSSMGGWIALRVFQEMQALGKSERLAGLILIAPAPDFATELMAPKFTDAQRALLEAQGYFDELSEYSSEPVTITAKLIEDGAKNTVLDKNLHLGVPVFVIQGMRDPDVPYEHALRLVENLGQDDVCVTLVNDGDHRLSRDEDIKKMLTLCGEAVKQATEGSV